MITRVLIHFQDSHLTAGHAVEIIGKVDQNLHIKVQAATDFGTDIGKFGCMIVRHVGCKRHVTKKSVKISMLPMLWLKLPIVTKKSSTMEND